MKLSDVPLQKSYEFILHCLWKKRQALLEASGLGEQGTVITHWHGSPHLVWQLFCSWNYKMGGKSCLLMWWFSDRPWGYLIIKTINLLTKTRVKSGILVLEAGDGIQEMARRMGLLAHSLCFYLEIELLNVKKKSSSLYMAFGFLKDQDILFSVVFISYGLDVLTDWTYSVLESWRMDRTQELIWKTGTASGQQLRKKGEQSFGE